MPLVKDVGRLGYFIMPESEAEDFAMLYTGRKDPDRAYEGKAIEINSLRDFYTQASKRAIIS